MAETSKFLDGYPVRIAPPYLLHAVLNDPQETSEHKSLVQAEIDRRTARLVETFKKIDRAIGNS